MENRCIKIALLVTTLAAVVIAQRDFEEPQPTRPQFLVLNPQEARNIRPRAYQSVHPPQNQVGGFRPQGGEDAVQAPTQQLRRPIYQQDPEPFQNIPLRQAHNKRPNAQLAQELKQRLEEEEEELEKEEPDKLSQLLLNSKFNCVGRNTGYYADEGLACEVFHYCQDNTKHSWICPDGFTFHQVHLICMPPSSDNICQKSSQYTFVNDYLYKALNADEAQSRPNVTLRYSERYYPSEVYHDGRYDEEEDSEDRERDPERAFQIQQAAAPRRPTARPQHGSPSPTPTPQRRQQVFRSPEEVDIPLHQRRPLHIPQPFHPSNNQEFEYEKK